MTAITAHHLRQALALDPFDSLAAQRRMSPPGRDAFQIDPKHPPRQSAVLILIYPDTQRNLQILLTQRASHLRGHSGQISFPGGKRDQSDSSYEYTARRETCEEVGICDHSAITVIGTLDSFWIPPSNYNVHPYVGIMSQIPHLTPNPDEVAQVFALPIATLLDDLTKQTTMMHVNKRHYRVPYYAVGEHIVWGATAVMLSELECRIKAIL